VRIEDGNKIKVYKQDDDAHLVGIKAEHIKRNYPTVDLPFMNSG